ncbi:VWA domain-containing protein [candidate division KSB1 bacterium]|nr:VWA domain-containing protein [candidate division KSB1 bacterium]
MSCNEKKAEFKFCDKKPVPRDVVFIIDQSGTMCKNDPQAVRWEGIIEVIMAMFHDEQKIQTDKNFTRFSIIPFGSSAETRKYNQHLKWFHHANFDSFVTYSNYWLQEAKKGGAQYSDFDAAFEILSQTLEWRKNATRYIFFISDGKYNILPHGTSELRRKIEQKKYRQMLMRLKTHHEEWPIYFIALGKPGVDSARHERNVNIAHLQEMAAAIPLPKFIIDDEPTPTFSLPGSGMPNFIALIDSNISKIKNDLQAQIEGILRRIRYFQLDVQNSDKIDFPLVRPDIVEIEVTTQNPRNTFKLMSDLALFVETRNSSFHLTEFELDTIGNQLIPGCIHRFKAATGVLDDSIPNWQDPKTIKQWGIEVRDEANVELTHVNLIIRDNWEIKIDSCRITLDAGKMGWFRRLFRRRSVPRYNLYLEVWAKHPCGATLPHGKLKVFIEGEESTTQEYCDFDSHPSPTHPGEIENIYTWKIQISNHPQFSQKTCAYLNIGLEIEDLYACYFDVPTEIPPNAEVHQDTTFYGNMSK